MAEHHYNNRSTYDSGVELETLENFLADFATSFDVKEDSSFVFDYDTLPDPPEALTTDALVIRKAVKIYDDIARVVDLWFHGTQQTYRLLGLLALATLFSKGNTKVALTLTHAETDISTLIVDAARPVKGGLDMGLSMIPYAFEYWPDSIEKHPWLHDDISPWELPRFALTAIDNPLMTVGDWESRNVVEGFGLPEGTTHLAQLLLDLSRPECPVKEIQLEGELGFRGVAPGSAEVRLWLPGSDGWNPEYKLD